MAEIRVPSGGNFQSALNSVQGGDSIVLDAGGTYQPSSDKGFVFPDLGLDANHQVTVRTSQSDNLPSGRIKISDKALLAKLVPNNDSKDTYMAASFPAKSKFWNLLGLEVTTLPNKPYAAQLVNLGEYTAWADAPSDINFDRVYIHSLEDGTTNPHATSRIGMNSFARRLNIKNSRLAMPAGYVMDSRSTDNQYAFLSEAGPGPITIDNCDLIAWYNAFFTGGASLPTDNHAQVVAGATMSQATLTNVAGTMPKVGDLLSFLETLPIKDNAGNVITEGRYGAVKVTAVNGNTIIYIPYAGSFTGQGSPLKVPPMVPGDAQWNGYLPTGLKITRSTIGNVNAIAQQIRQEIGNYPKGWFEIKAIDDMLLEGNTFVGMPSNLAFTARNQGTPHGAPSVWSTIKNVIIRNCMMRGETPSSLRELILQLEDNYATSTPGGNILIENNLFPAVGQVADMAAGDNVTIRHNTWAAPLAAANSMINNIGMPVTNFVFRDNVAPNNEYGVHCQDGGYGCFPGLFESDHFKGNVIVGEAQPYRPTCGDPYPAGNYCTPSYAGLFEDPASGNYRLTAASGLKGKATDGKDPGVDMDALMAALAGNAPTPVQTYSLVVNGGTGAGIFDAGTVAPIAAQVPTQKQFSQWKGDAVKDSTSPNTSITMNQNSTVTAEFKDMPPITTKNNVALGSTGSVATASTTLAAWSAASAAINGERAGKKWGTDPVNGSGWNSLPNAFPATIQVKFPSVKSISEIDVFCVQDDYNNPVEPTAEMKFKLYGLVDFDIQYWNGTTWVNITQVKNNNNVWVKSTFDAVKTDQVRLVITRSPDQYARVTEIEVYEAEGGGDVTTTQHFTVSMDCEVTVTNGVATGVKLTQK